MNPELSTIVRVGPGLDSGLHQLEVRRNNLYGEINSLTIPDDAKRRARAEVDFLIDYAKARRVQVALQEWHRCRSAFRLELAASRADVRNRLVLEQSRVRMQLFEDRRRRIQATLDVLERARRLAPKDEIRDLHIKARKESLRQQLAGRVSRISRKQLQEELADMVLARGRFHARVRKHFPDMEDELMEKYDAHMFARGVR